MLSDPPLNCPFPPPTSSTFQAPTGAARRIHVARSDYSRYVHAANTSGKHWECENWKERPWTFPSTICACSGLLSGMFMLRRDVRVTSSSSSSSSQQQPAAASQHHQQQHSARTTESYDHSTSFLASCDSCPTVRLPAGTLNTCTYLTCICTATYNWKALLLSCLLPVNARPT